MIQMITIYSIPRIISVFNATRCQILVVIYYNNADSLLQFFTLATSKNYAQGYSHYSHTCTRTDRKCCRKDSCLIIVELINVLTEVVLLQAQLCFCVWVTEETRLSLLRGNSQSSGNF